jgi:hypothetical protein
MSGYVKPIPGARARSGKRLGAFLKRVADKAGVRVEVKAKEYADKLLADIIATTPVYTGASKGVQGPFAYRMNYPYHPANNIKGDLGWYMIYRKINQYAGQFVIGNPMWDPYLRYVEYGFTPSESERFLRNAWAKHLAVRRKDAT